MGRARRRRACDCNLPSERPEGANPPALSPTYANTPIRSNVAVLHVDIYDIQSIDGRKLSSFISSHALSLLLAHIFFF